MQLFFLPNLDSNTFAFSEEESKHCIRVLRKKIGDTLTLIDGKGTEATAMILDDHPKKCTGKIISRTQHTPNRNYYLHLAIAPTKNFDRIEWMLEKAIEIGVDEISFIETENSERAKINMDRCEKIAVSAIKQSKQFFLPKINPIRKFNSFMKEVESYENKWIAWCPTNNTETLAKQIKSLQLQQHLLLVGPEGDFSLPEIELSKTYRFKPISLGPNILRTETAGILGVSAFALNAQSI